jgi:hypothetical protein
MKVLGISSRVIQRLGIVLFVVSFPLSSPDGCGLGLGPFVLTPVMAVVLWANSHNLVETFGAVALLTGWLANFSVLARFPRSLAWIPMIAPWILFSALMAECGIPNGRRFATFLPFYVWAFGIALIHVRSYLDGPEWFGEWIDRF